MRAVVITAHGGVGALTVQEVADATPPTADRVRVRVRAAGVNRADIMQREGNYPAPAGYPQNIPGLEFAGEIESLGEAVCDWEIGDRVFGITAGGAQAEFVLVPASNLARIPRNSSGRRPRPCQRFSSPRTTHFLPGRNCKWASGC
jgi:NADPH:quinone reductase-like Zn-dependent oxidoreductase